MTHIGLFGAPIIALREQKHSCLFDHLIVNIKTFMDGHRPPDRVLPSML